LTAVDEERIQRSLQTYIYFHGLTDLVGLGLFTVEASRSHTIKTYLTRQDSPGRVIGSSQKSLPDTTQHSRVADIQGFKPAISACERRQTDAAGMVMDI
jgi:hypothetical protein